MVFSKKKPELLKTAKISEFDVECDWNSKISQNFQKVGASPKMGLPKIT